MPGFSKNWKKKASFSVSGSEAYEKIRF